MNKNKFVDTLRKIAPSRETLKKYNVSDDFIDTIIKRYHCVSKDEKNVRLFTYDTILTMLQEYDCSTVEIAIIMFDKDIHEADNYYKIGNAELDALVLNKITKEIEVRDHDSLNHIIWKCASNSDNFLEALLHCAAYLTSRFNNFLMDDDDQNVILQQVEVCTIKAGGDEYRDFYKMLLGYFG